MARLADVAPVLRSAGVLAFAKRVWTNVQDDNLFTWASALSYSWLFAVFPFLLFLLSLVPYLPAGAKVQAKAEIETLIHQAFPAEAAKTVWTNVDQNLENILHRPRGWLLVVGLALALYAASGGMASTMTALDQCYDLPRTGGRTFFRHRLAALGLTVVAALLILAVVVLLPVGAIVKAFLVARSVLPEGSALLVVFDLARWLLAVAFLVVALAVVYHKGVAVRHRFRWVTPGGVFCLTVWVLLGLAFRVYVGNFGNYNETYGAVGGVVILLLMFYLDALVLLVGAEINGEIDFAVLNVPRGTRNLIPAEVAVEVAEEREEREERELEEREAREAEVSTEEPDNTPTADPESPAAPPRDGSEDMSTTEEPPRQSDPTDERP